MESACQIIAIKLWIFITYIKSKRITMRQMLLK